MSLTGSFFYYFKELSAKKSKKHDMTTIGDILVRKTAFFIACWCNGGVKIKVSLCAYQAFEKCFAVMKNEFAVLVKIIKRD